MRRLVLSCVALLVVPALAFAGATATQGKKTLKLEVGLSPAKASKKKGNARPVAATYDYWSGTTDDSPIPDIRSVKVDLAGAVFGFDAFPKCSEAKVSAEGPSACPNGSQVGQGRAIAELHLVTTTTDVPVNVRLFNGALAKSEGGEENLDGLLVYTEAAGQRIVLPMEATDGNKAVVLRNAPEDEDPNADRPYAVKEIHLTLPRRTVKQSKRRVPFLSAPAKCKRKWTARTTNDYYDGGPLTATHDIKCKKA